MSPISIVLVMLGSVAIILSLVWLRARRPRHLAEITAAVGLFLVGIGIILPHFQPQSSNRLKPAVISQKKAATSSKSHTKTTGGSTAATPTGLPTDPAIRAMLNAVMAQQLNRYQGLSRGTADGGPSTPTGTHHHEYDWALYLKRVVIDSNQHVVAQTDAFKFSTLVLTSRKELARHVQELTLEALAKQKLASTTIRRRGVYVTLYADKKIVVQSKRNDFRQFRVSE